MSDLEFVIWLCVSIVVVVTLLVVVVWIRNGWFND